MYQGKHVAAIIVAAGTGSRIGGAVPKQFMNIGGKPMLVRTIEAFISNASIDTVCVVVNEAHVEFCRMQILSGFYDSGKIGAVVPGGDTRQESVWAGLAALPADVDLVLVHDGARPFVSHALMDSITAAAAKHGAAAAAVPVKDTIKQIEGNVFVETPDRETLYAAQTPQGFSREILYDAYVHAKKIGFTGTDDAVLVEKTGKSVYLVLGDYSNIKITTREDLAMANSAYDGENACGGGNMLRIGSGYDVHRLVSGRSLILGGVTIPHGTGLLGHSDADVLTHALMDALLGAANLGDIGRHFPDSDAQYKDSTSVVLLKRVTALLGEAGYRLENADITVMAEKPKLAPYMKDMQRCLAAHMQVDENQISIKATTTEGLGFTGREEGIAALATVLIRRNGT